MPRPSIQVPFRRALLLAFVSLLWSMALPAQDARLTDDASVSSSSPNANNGGAATMIIRGGPAVQRGFVKFDL